MKRGVIITAAVLSLAVAGVFSAGVFLPSTTFIVSARAAAAEHQVTFAIENMTCALCPVTVKKAMEGVVGVKSVTVDFDAKTATIVFDPSEATIANIAAASTNAGYPAQAING